MENALLIAAFVVVLLLGIAAVQVAIWMPIIRWFRRKSGEAKANLEVEIEAEGVIRPPERANYRGATGQGYPVVKNNGVLSLTRSRLVFRSVTGKSIDIPVDAITGVRESKVFKGSLVGGHTHLIICTRAGEVGFYVSDNDAWTTAILDAQAGSNHPGGHEAVGT